jgi:hypothetical protein
MSLSRDDIYEVLSNQRRRFVLHHLRQNGDRETLGTLAEQIAAWEDGVAVDRVTSNHRKNVYTSLQQFHLPKMDERGVVEFDSRAGEVELTDDAEDVDVYLEVVRAHDVPWSLYYFAAGLMSALVVAGHAVGLPLLAGLTELECALFTATAIGTMALAHTYYTKTMRLGRDGPPPEVQE